MTDKKLFMQIAIDQSKKFEGRPAPIVPFANWDYYYIKGKVKWTPPTNSQFKSSIVVPIGFVTDLASVPRVFWSVLPPTAKYSYAAIVHDYLYWEQPCDRETADLALKEAMDDLSVSAVDSFAIYKGVRVGGASSWSANCKAKASGEKRILTNFPDGYGVTWDEWKKDPNNFLD